MNSKISTQKTKTDPTLEISNKEIGNTNKSVIETDKVNKPSKSNINSQTDLNPNILRRSTRIRDLTPISYKEPDNVTKSIYTCAQSVVCNAPKTYSEIKDCDDRLK